LSSPPVAAVLVKIVGVRRGTEPGPSMRHSSHAAVAWRPTPGGVDERGRMPAKLPRKDAGETGAEHILPESARTVRVA